MKANRKFMENEEAVSPVIAVILMVAITVVLAATVFVLVNNLSENVTETAPVLSMANDRNTAAEWKASIISASQSLQLDSYQFLYTLPSGRIVEINPSATFETLYGDLAGSAREVIQGGNTTAAGATTANGAVKVTFTDTDGNSRFSPTDSLSFTFDSNDGDATYDDTWSAGEYKLQILHKNSGGIVREMTRTV